MKLAVENKGHFSITVTVCEIIKLSELQHRMYFLFKRRIVLVSGEPPLQNFSALWCQDCPTAHPQSAMESHRKLFVLGPGTEPPNVGVQWVALCFLFWRSLVHISARRPVILIFSWLSSVSAVKFWNTSSNWAIFFHIFSNALFSDYPRVVS